MLLQPQLFVFVHQKLHKDIFLIVFQFLVLVLSYLAFVSKSTDQLLDIFDTINDEGQTIVMVTHSTKAASYAKRVLFIRDGEVFHQLYKGNQTNEEMYQSISDTLTLLATGGK